MIIKRILVRKIENSRNDGAIEILVKSDIGKAKASAPSGKSKGKYEKLDFKENINNIIINAKITASLFLFTIL